MSFMGPEVQTPQLSNLNGYVHLAPKSIAIDLVDQSEPRISPKIAKNTGKVPSERIPLRVSIPYMVWEGGLILVKPFVHNMLIKSSLAPRLRGFLHGCLTFYATDHGFLTLYATDHGFLTLYATDHGFLTFYATDHGFLTL